MSTVAQNIGGVGVQIGRVVEKNSEMDSLVPQTMLTNFLEQRISISGHSSIFITWAGNYASSPPSFAL